MGWPAPPRRGGLAEPRAARRGRRARGGGPAEGRRSRRACGRWRAGRRNARRCASPGRCGGGRGRAPGPWRVMRPDPGAGRGRGVWGGRGGTGCLAVAVVPGDAPQPRGPVLPPSPSLCFCGYRPSLGWGQSSAQFSAGWWDDDGIIPSYFSGHWGNGMIAV